MSYTHVNDAKKWKIAPVNALILTIPTLDASAIRIENLEQGSSIKVEAITRQTDTGGFRTVGYKMTGEFALIQDNFETFNPLLKAISNNEVVTAIKIELKAMSGETNAMTMNVMPDASTDVKDFTVTFDINAGDDSPQVTLNITGILSKDAFDDVTNYFFDEV